MSSEAARQWRGTGIALLGALCVTPNAVILRWANSTKTTLGAVIFWKLL